MKLLASAGHRNIQTTFFATNSEKSHKLLFQKFDLNLEMPQFLEFLDTTNRRRANLRHRVKSRRVGKVRISGFKQIVSRLLAW